MFYLIALASVLNIPKKAFDSQYVNYSIAHNEIEVYGNLIDRIGELSGNIEYVKNERKDRIDKLNDAIQNSKLMTNNGISSFEEWIKYSDEYAIIYQDMDDLREIKIKNPEIYSKIKKFVEAEDYDEKKIEYKEIINYINEDSELMCLSNEVYVLDELLNRIEEQNCESLLPPMIRNMMDRDIKIISIMFIGLGVIVFLIVETKFPKKNNFKVILKSITPVYIISIIGYSLCIVLSDLKKFLMCNLLMGQGWLRLPWTMGGTMAISFICNYLVFVFLIFIGTKIVYEKNKNK